MRRIVTLVALASLALIAAAGPATARPALAKSEIAVRILNSPQGQYLSPAARSVLQKMAGYTQIYASTRGVPGSTLGPSGPNAVTAGDPGLPNVRVNDPSADGQLVDQTQQKAPSIAVHGSNVVVGFYDSQAEFGTTFTAATNVSGVAYSADGGQTFNDAGVVPMAPGYFGYAGYSSVTSDDVGNFYYSNWMFNTRKFHSVPGVAKSADGGKTWSTPIDVAATAEAKVFSYQTEFPSIASGGGVLYEVWDAFVDNGNSVIGFAKSTDGGATWTNGLVSQASVFSSTCSFQYFQGARALVAPDGAVYIAANQTCFSVATNQVQVNQVFFASTDGGSTWSQGASNVIASSTQGLGAFDLGPGRFIPNDEFPSVGLAGASIYMAWNDGGDGTHSHIKLARSTDHGQTWTNSWITSGTNNEIEPALTADASGIHVLYYQLVGAQPGCSNYCAGTGTANGAIDVLVSNSTDGSAWTPRRVTNQTSPGIFTMPPFDAFTPYYAEYISSATDGTHQYFAWGDNRDIVTNWTWPRGRHDVDVFFAKQ